MANGLAEFKVKEISGKKLEFPLQWFTWYTGKPKPWKITDCEGVFVNAFNLAFEQTKTKKEEIIEKGIHDFLELNGNQPVFMDSGGFQFLRRGSNPDIDSILEFQISSKADIIAVFDYPFSPKDSTEEKLLRMEKTLRNIEKTARFISEHGLDVTVVPVIHAHEEKILEKAINLVRSIEEKYEIDFPIYALGSMVYLVSATMTAKFARYYRFIDLILEARRLLPEKILHVFGVGSPNVMYLLMYLGVDSIETFGWAGHGIHYSTYVAGHGTKALSDRKRALDSELDLDSYSCDCVVCTGECPILNGRCAAYDGNCILTSRIDEVKHAYQRWINVSGLQRRKLRKQWTKKVVEDILNSHGSWISRACHNACVYSKEMKAAKTALKEGEYENFIKTVMNNSLYNKARLLDYAKARIHEINEA